MDLKSILSRVARAGAATMVVAGCLAGAVSADGGGEMPSSHPMLLLNTLGSQNWAGWASFGGTFLLPQPGAVTYVKGEWTVPTLKCASGNGDSSIWVGIDGMTTQTVEQIGTEQDCVNGQPLYKAWWETYPNPKTPISMPVKPGDAMRGEVKYVGNGQFTLTLANLTTGQTFQTTQSAPGAARSSAEWIVEAPYQGGVLPLANFGSVSFRNARSTVNGSTGPIVRGGGLLGIITNLLTAQGFQMTGLLNPKASASNPANSAGDDAFTVTWIGR